VDLKEKVFMKAPPRFSEDFQRNEVCKLKKALYGLKQSPGPGSGGLQWPCKGTDTNKTTLTILYS